MFSDQPLHFSRHYAGLIGVLEGWIMSYDPRLLFEEISICLRESPSKTLLDISNNLQVSRRTIEKAISTSTGGTFRRLREEILLTRFRSLCASQPTLAIKELCFAVGFKSATSFARAIKRACGSSPEELRFRVVGEVLDAHNRGRTVRIYT
jgi:AraC-like DNA-binding protein